jgi:hypothetical protein
MKKSITGIALLKCSLLFYTIKPTVYMNEFLRVLAEMRGWQDEHRKCGCDACYKEMLRAEAIVDTIIKMHWQEMDKAATQNILQSVYTRDKRLYFVKPSNN